MDEFKLLQWLSIPELWEKYAPLLKVDYFSPENRSIVSKALQATSPIPSSLIATWDSTAHLYIQDWLIRIQLKELQNSINKDIVAPGLLSLNNLDTISEKCDLTFGEDTSTRILSSKQSIKPVRYPTGLKFLTEALGGGFSPGELCLICSPPHGGKTHLLIKLASSYLKRGFRVIHFILEDLPGDIIHYYQDAIQGLQLAPGRVIDLERGLYLYDFSGENCSTTTISRIIKDLGTDSRPTIVIIDYADLLNDHLDREEWVRDKLLAHRLRSIANEHKVILLTATQGLFTMMSDKTPNLSHLQGFKVGKAAAADVVLIWRPDDLSNEGLLVIAKARGRKVRERSFDLSVDWSNFQITRL